MVSGLIFVLMLEAHLGALLTSSSVGAVRFLSGMVDRAGRLEFGEFSAVEEVPGLVDHRRSIADFRVADPADEDRVGLGLETLLDFSFKGSGRTVQQRTSLGPFMPVEL